ncbi:L-lactate permease [Mechercharimyces sp. CAU 1602]|uniref:L-lactate permease n=1 Tax=Mechercharimyces sp. CAU 1602 TaxID=2973933 RepID=UPI002162D452|nr:L-lactate permease [Mechercharimyces sp. CAU 1602]MCS1351621.1 L-lactate permease [Mechercharimyces sp. CAU 1602]
MTLFLASLPILIIFFLLFICKRSTVEAALVACMFAMLVPFFSSNFSLPLTDLLQAVIKGILTTSIVSYVLIFGIFLYHLMNATGAIKSIAHFVASTTDNPTRQVILLVLAFSPLLESASGFGVSVVVITPILISLGFDRFKAVAMSIIGLTAVPWGALATGSLIGVSLIDMPLERLGTGTALFSIPIFFYFAIIIVLLAGGLPALKKHAGEIMLVSGTLSISIWFFSSSVSVELAGVFGGLLALSIYSIYSG